MKVKFRYVLFASAAILAAVACNKSEPDNQQPNTPIAISATEAGVTKALLDNETFKADGVRLQIYDFVGESNVPHINDRIGPDVKGSALAESTEGVWPFEDPENKGPYQWTPETHKFFGWLANDPNGTKDNKNDDLTPQKFWGTGFVFNETTKVLTIPETVMNESTTQFDFLYSNIVTRDMMTAPDYSTVNLEFQHLFTAVSFGASNGTETDVTIQEFKIEKILNKKSATINFSGTNPAVAYVNGTQNQYLTLTNSKSYKLGSEDYVNNIFDGTKNQKFLMLWPLESKDIHSTAEVQPGDDGNVDFEDYPAEYKMYIKYTFADEPGLTIEKRMNFPDINFEAGKKYHFDIAFADKTVSLKTTVKNWIHDKQEIDYANSAVTVPGGGVLRWNDSKSTLMESETGEKLVVIKNGQPAEADFTIDTPLGGVWLISLSGDIDAFRVDPDNGEINAATAHIRVVPLIEDPKREYKVKLKFAVRRPDGRIIAADELVQPASTKRTVVLSPM